ncbi:hypothetical protein Purlil1_12926 [Purpureocillium lilacinum]|uniref:HAT C-terminal dimerisation domain-containing protein n=1 Tax=Purpureocillium lilacinum TaxID=33203 RepID=A0ABR0BFK8_PURLI|nr:hypothetical protein Purlil1_12926 [Purpureocillium lilacinum]
MSTSLTSSAFSILRAPRSLASQLEQEPPAALPDHPTIADLPHALWRNKRYVLEESLSRKGSKGRKSWIRGHGLFVVEIDANNVPLNPYWACRLCDAKGQSVLFAATATTSAADHLRKAHRIFEGSSNSDSSTSTDEPDRAKRPRLQYSLVPRAKIKTIRELSLGLVINADLPFSVFTDPYFEQLVWQLDPRVADQIPWSRQSMSRQLDEVYKSKSSLVRQELRDALTKIHLSFDLWTSPNRYAVMAVTAHFLDRQGHHQVRLLALRRQLGSHSGENLAATLLEVVNEWGIQDSVGCVVSDNVTTNDACLQHLYKAINPEMRPADIRARRMRCYGHILNLVARAFLYGEDFEAFEAESQVNSLLSRQEEDLRHWRKKGPVGKLHNVVRFIRSSPQRSELFKMVAHENDEAQGFRLAVESTAELEVVMNNDTRWNSTYLMLSRALLKQGDLRAFFIHPDVEGKLPQEDILTADDWRLLAEIKHVLEPIYLQTMRAQGWGKGDGHGRLWEVMTGIEYLLEHLEDWKVFYDEVTEDMVEKAASQCRLPRGHASPGRRRLSRTADQLDTVRRQTPGDSGPEHVREAYAEQRLSSVSRVQEIGKDHRHYLRLCITTAWQKLNEYYAKLGESPLFAAAIILHPALGMKYLETNWESEEQLVWVRDAKMGLVSYFERWYRGPQPREPCDQQLTKVMEGPTVTGKAREESEFRQWVRSRMARPASTGSEVERYIRMEPQETENPVDWWLAQQTTFPMLSKLALDILAIPAMSSDCERSFSLAKLSLTSQRLSMSPATLEALQCLKNWTRQSAVKLGAVKWCQGWQGSGLVDLSDGEY